ncbi:MAG TPA: hypothetical protein PK710_12745, partial [Polyangiaceae bacterium]|nr:hypothetical protein [Polyangiaceae bacterium]
AGTFTYPDASAAQTASTSLEQIAQLSSYARLLSLLGIQPPIQDLKVRVVDQDVQFIAAINVQGASSLMEWWASSLRR